MKVRDFEHAIHIMSVLEEGRMTENPEVKIKCEAAWDTRDISLLQEILDEYPGIYEEALRNIDEKQTWEEKEPFRPYPEGEEVEKIAGPLPLGYANKNPVGLYSLDLTLGLFVCGEIGSGKTYAVLRLYDHILSIPIEQRGFNVVIIQVVKNEADYLIKRHPYLRIIDWGKNFRRNIFEVEPWENPFEKYKTACAIFSSVNYLLSMTQPILKRAVFRCYEKNKVFDGKNNFPNFSEILGEIDNAAADMGLGGYEHRNYRDKLKLRLSDFIEVEVMDCKHGYRIDTFWSKEDICLNVMTEPSPYVYGTAITDILINLQKYHQQNPSHPPRLKTLIGIDECRSVFPVKNNQIDFESDRFLEQFISTARSSGMGRITITQEPQSVPSWLSNNSAFFMTFPIAGEAVDHLKKLQNLSDAQIDFINRLPPSGTCIFRDRRFDRPYLLEIPGDLEIEAVTEGEVEEIMAPFIKRLEAQLPKDIVLQPVETSKKYSETDLIKMRKVIYPETLHLIQHLQKEPYTSKTELFKGYIRISQQVNTF